MNVILYTLDFEPITVLDLPLWVIEKAEKQGAVKIAVAMPVKAEEITDLSVLRPKILTVMCNKIRWSDNTVKTILVTPDEELALTTKPAWLPGQVASSNAAVKAIRTLTERLIKAMRK